MLKQQYLEALSWQGGGGHRHALLPWKPSKDTENITDDIDIEGIVYFLKKLEIFAEKAVGIVSIFSFCLCVYVFFLLIDICICCRNLMNCVSV